MAKDGLHNDTLSVSYTHLDVYKRQQYEHIMREVDGAGGDAHDFR